MTTFIVSRPFDELIDRYLAARRTHHATLDHIQAIRDHADSILDADEGTTERTPNPAIEALHERHDDLYELVRGNEEHTKTRFDTDRRAIDALTKRVAALEHTAGETLTDYRTWQRANEAPTVYSDTPCEVTRTGIVTNIQTVDGHPGFEYKLDGVNFWTHWDYDMPTVGDHVTVTHTLMER